MSQNPNDIGNILAGRARIGAARVRVANVGGEEFEEAIGGAFTGGADEGKGAVGDGRDLVHALE
jgi:hypothetical protein